MIDRPNKLRAHVDHQHSLPMYFARLYLSNSGHCTINVSLRRYAIFPERERLWTRQKLSTNTMRQFRTPKNFQTQAARMTGIQVPGPLHNINCGLMRKILTTQLRRAFKVMKIVNHQDI
uniref:Uncharacterized protein n=1 Tax=Lotharella globosa TaxID=91324 RepID=A0A6V3QY31_9EUKA